MTKQRINRNRQRGKTGGNTGIVAACVLLVAGFVGLMAYTKLNKTPLKKTDELAKINNVGAALVAALDSNPKTTEPKTGGHKTSPTLGGKDKVLKSPEITVQVKNEKAKEPEIKTITLTTYPDEARKLHEKIYGKPKPIEKGPPSTFIPFDASKVSSTPKSLSKKRSLADFISKSSVIFGNRKRIEKKEVIYSNKVPEIKIDSWILDSFTQVHFKFSACVSGTLKKTHVISNSNKEKLLVSFHPLTREPVNIFLYSPTHKKKFGTQFDPVKSGRWMQYKVALSDFIDETGARMTLDKGDKISTVYILQGKFYQNAELTVSELRIIKDTK